MKKLPDYFKNITDRTKGVLITLILSLAVLIYFFGPILAAPNKYYFDQNGDGLLTYYYATYQLKYDSSYWHLGATNYPYGESVFFSSDQPVITAVLRFINNNLLTIEDSIPGIFNSLMLYSFCLCAICIYLVLYELSVNNIYAALFAVGITFLSPQWARIPAHFPLSYAFAVPGLLYLLLRFYKEPSFKRSIGIGLYVFIMACMHAYFIGLFGIVFVVYYLFNSIKRKGFFRNLMMQGLHFSIQLLAPVVLLQLWINATSSVNDRTTTPWGFLYYVSSFDNMFFPYGKPYQEIMAQYNTPEEVLQPEGISYVGLFAFSMIVAFLLRKGGQLTNLQFREFFTTGLNFPISFMIVAGILGALYACGIPYIYNPNLTHYVGPLRQMRGLGRFAWLFYYMANIFSAWFFYKVVQRAPKTWIKVLICALPLYILCSDAYYQVMPVSRGVANLVPQINDVDNKLPENLWVKEIDYQEYQAIIPLPYFLLGSENLGTEPTKRGILREAYIASMKTGLPLTAGILSRTSLSQAARNMCLVTEVYRPLKIVQDFPSTKPLLILARDTEITDPVQRELLKWAKPLKITPGFNLYRLEYKTLAGISDSLYNSISRESQMLGVHEVEGWRSTDSVRNFAYKNFDDTPTPLAYRGRGALIGKIKDYNRIFEDTIPGAQDNANYIMTFWVGNFTMDLLPRATMEITFSDSATGNKYGGWWTALGSHVRVLDSTWALIEVYIKLPHRHDKMFVTVWSNEFIDDTPMIIDEFWIKPEFTHLYKLSDKEVFKNNRYYVKP